MKKIVAFCCSLFFVSLSAQAQLGHEWINFGQSYYKIPVAKDGIYRLTYLDLQNAGFPVGSVDPKTLQIYHRGQEHAIYVEGEDDTQFNPTDFIEFYGQRNDGTLDAELYKPASMQPHAYYALYNDTTSYFLTFGAINGRRMAVVDESNTSSIPGEAYHTDQNLLILNQNYSPGFTTNDILNTYFDQGEGWTGAQLWQNQTIDYTLSNLLQVSAGNGLPELELVVVGRWSVPNTPEIYVGPTAGSVRLLSTIPLDGYESKKIVQQIQWADIGGDGKLVVRVKAVGTNARLSASYVLLRYPQGLTMAGAAEKVFRLAANASDKSYIEIANPSAGARLFDITDPTQVRRIMASGSGTLNAIVTNTAVPRKLFASNTTLKPAVKAARFRAIVPAEHDYIIISHKLLMRSGGGYSNPVKEYAAYRASEAGGSYDTLVVDVDLLYNQFSYGEQTPVAIYRFMKFLVQSHMPQYLLIIGKGLSVHMGYFRNPVPFILYKDLVPASGLPGSDIAYTAGLAGTDYEPAVPTGRISANSPDDVAAYLNKVKEMEALPFNDLWRKNLLHLSGGIEEGEPAYFKSILENFADVAKSYHLGGAVSARAKRSREIEQNIDISAEVNKGLGLVTFFGHSSPTTLDFDIGFATNPVLGYNNKGKYPMLLINGCNAGSFFLYNKLFGEDWISAPNKGAVGVIAHAYYGLLSTLEAYSSVFYEVGYRDSTFITKGIGNIHKEVARRYIAYNGTSIYNITQAQQMVLLGDPAVKLFGAPKADYEINADNLSVESFTGEPVTAESDSFALKIIVRNFGQAKEGTFRIEVQRRYNDNTVVTYDSLFDPVMYSDTIMFVIRKDRNSASGNNNFTVTIDPDGVVKELNESNNTASLGFAIPLNGTRNLYPYKYAIVSNKQVNLSLQSTDVLSGERDFLIEVDTTDKFDSDFRKTFTVKAKVYAWQGITLLDQDSLTYYWRTKLANPLPGESETWSVNSFSYIAGSPEGWAQMHFPQYHENPAVGLVKDPELRLLEFPETVTDVSIRTFGANRPSVITDINVRIAGAEYNLTTQGFTCRYNTLNLIAFDRRSAVPYIGIPFKWYNRAGRACGREPWVINSFLPGEMITGKGDDIEAYVNNIAPGDSVVLYTTGNAAYATWPAAAKTKLGELGISVAQINALAANEPVVIFARKGLAPGQAMVIRASAPADQAELLVNKSITGRYTSGEMTSVSIGPAARWMKLASRTHGATANDLTTIEIIGVKLNGEETSLATGVSGDRDLSTIDAGEYPLLKLKYTATDNVDLTAVQLSKWLVLYEPVAEGMLVYAGSPEQQVVAEGVTWNGPYGFVNISNKAFTDSLRVDLDVFNTPARFSQKSTFKIKAPAPGDTTWFNATVPTLGKTGLNDVNVFVNRRIMPEQYYDNNVLELRNYLNIQSDAFDPVLDVTIDGRRVINGDFVSPNPSIKVRLWDENRHLLKKDTTGVVLLLSDTCGAEECAMRRIYFTTPGISWAAGTDSTDFTVVYKAQSLAEGKYLLRVSATDARGNASGEADYEVTFFVSMDRSVLMLPPYPNPLQASTLFRIVVAGSDEPVAASIQFTSVAGVPVQEISRPLHVGTNELSWSGTDATGNLLPPGVYIYRIQLSAGGEAYRKIGKVVIVR